MLNLDLSDRISDNVPSAKPVMTIARAVAASFEEEVALVSRLVKSPSPNSFTPSDSPLHEAVEGEVPSFIFEALKGIGLMPKYVGPSRERLNVVAEWGEKRGRNSLMLNGHMDTTGVDPKNGAGMFSGVVRDGKLYGLGSLDMKATLAAYIFAVKALMKCNIKLSGKLSLAFVVDEESGACSEYGSKYLLENGYTPKACFIGEHGNEYVRVGQRGVYRFRLKVKGKSVHTGMSAWEKREEGHNAVVDMASAITALQQLKIPYKVSKMFEGRKPVFTFPTKIEGGNSLSIVPDICSAYGDVRTLPGNSDAQIKLLMVECLSPLGINYEIEDLSYAPAVEVDVHDPVVLSLQKAAKKVLGYTPIPRVSGPATDAWMFIQRDIPTIMGFGPIGGGAHERREWVDLESLKKMTEVYAQFIADYLG